MESTTEKNMGITEKKKKNGGSAEPISIDHPVSECQGINKVLERLN